MKKIKCPERLKCGQLYCCKQEDLPKSQPVHEACLWYHKYRDRKIRKYKLLKLKNV